MSQTLQLPMDLLALSLAERVQVKIRGGRTLIGTLDAYDAHLNLLMSQVEEQSVDNSEHRHMDVLFVRGDGILVCTALATKIK